MRASLSSGSPVVPPAMGFCDGAVPPVVGDSLAMNLRLSNMVLLIFWYASLIRVRTVGFGRLRSGGSMFSIVEAKLGNVFIKEMTPFRFLILTFVSSMPRICSSKKRSNTVTRRS